MCERRRAEGIERRAGVDDVDRVNRAGSRNVSRLSADDDSGQQAFVARFQQDPKGRASARDPQRIGATDVGAHPLEARLETAEYAPLVAVARNQMDHVHSPVLPDSVDAADALLEAHWIPRQLEVDDESTRALEVESLAAGVRREQKAAAPCVKR